MQDDNNDWNWLLSADINTPVVPVVRLSQDMLDTTRSLHVTPEAADQISDGEDCGWLEWKQQ